MREGAKQLKIENKKLNINDIENMQDDLTDLFEVRTPTCLLATVWVLWQDSAGVFAHVW